MISPQPWDQVFARSEDLVLREIVDERLLVPIRGKLADLRCIYALGGLGPVVWDQIDGKRTLGEIRAGLSERYDAPLDVLENDLLEFLSALQEAGLVVRHP